MLCPPIVHELGVKRHVNACIVEKIGAGIAAPFLVASRAPK